MSSDAGPPTGESAVPPVADAGVILNEDTDGRERWAPASKYPAAARKQQRWEGAYLLAIIGVSLSGAIAWAAGLAQQLCAWASIDERAGEIIAQWLLLAFSGLLGGTVYGAKWLYHAVAKGLWHEDRRLWRFLSPWISMGAAFGVGALLQAGVLRAAPPAAATWDPNYLIAIGFLIGYLADKALAKMKDVTEVLFGETRERIGRPKNE